MSVELYREIVSVMLPPALLAHFDVVDVKMRLFAPGEQLGVEGGEITLYLDESDALREQGLSGGMCYGQR